jgi:hypothetical protein
MPILTIFNRVQDLALKIRIPAGLDGDHYQVGAYTIPTGKQVEYLLISDNAAYEEGKAYVFTTSTRLGMLEFSLDVVLTGKKSGSSYTCQIHINTGTKILSSKVFDSNGTETLSDGVIVTTSDHSAALPFEGTIDRRGEDVLLTIKPQ